MAIMDSIKNQLSIIKQIISTIDIDKIDDLFKKYQKLLGVRPNGFLGGIPLIVLSTEYTQDNKITGYKSYLKESFNENMFVNPYSLQVECLLYGLTWKKELENFLINAKKRDYTIFYYTKLNKTYAPVVVSSVSYSEDYQSNTDIKVKFTLKEINLLQFTKNEDGTTTTNAYDATTNTQNRELTAVNQSDNLNDAMSGDIRTGGVA